MSGAIPARRTQESRREATKKKILEAATDALIELGYARASVSQICERAGVSQGGLFRHFPTTEDLWVAVGEHVGARILERFRRDFRKIEDSDDAPAEVLRLARVHCRSRHNQAFYELALAARTSPILQKALEPVTKRYLADIESLATQLLPDVAAKLGADFTLLVDTILLIFDGEVMRRFVLRRPELEERRLAMIEALLRPLLTSSKSPSKRARAAS